MSAYRFKVRKHIRIKKEHYIMYQVLFSISGITDLDLFIRTILMCLKSNLNKEYAKKLPQVVSDGYTTVPIRLSVSNETLQLMYKLKEELDFKNLATLFYYALLCYAQTRQVKLEVDGKRII